MADRAEHGQRRQGQDEQAVQQQRRVERERGGVIERDAAVHPEQRPAEPAQRRGVEHHQQTVHPRVEPRRAPGPQEDERDHEEHGRETIDRHRPSRPFAHREGERRTAPDAGRGEDQRRDQIVAEAERAVDGALPSPRAVLIKADRQQQVDPEGHAERRHDAEEFAQDVLGGGERRAVEQAGNGRLFLAEHRQAGHERREKRVGQEAAQGEGLGQGIRRVDEHPGAPDLGIARRDHRHRVEDARHQEHQRKKDPEQRSGQLGTELVPRNGPEPARVHEVSDLEHG